MQGLAVSAAEAASGGARARVGSQLGLFFCSVFSACASDECAVRQNSSLAIILSHFETTSAVMPGELYRFLHRLGFQPRPLGRLLTAVVLY